jgi:RNA polymerase sigma-70 factor (ECF subfamily)
MNQILHLLSLPTMKVNLLAGFAAIAWRSTRSGDADEGELLERLRAGDEAAFMALVERHQSSMIRLARSFVGSAAVAEEVVQDTWLGVLRGIDKFAGRSSFRTWLLKILVNRARTTGAREGRSVAIGDAGPAVDAGRFDATGAWAAPPEHWVQDTDDRLEAEQLADTIRVALEELPGRQREVLLLRDVDGLTSEEVCDVLDISEGNQRVLLHRGRSRLRQALEDAAAGEAA